MHLSEFKILKFLMLFMLTLVGSSRFDVHDLGFNESRIINQTNYIGDAQGSIISVLGQKHSLE